MVKSNHLILIVAACDGNVAIMKQYLSSDDPMVNFTITPDSQTALWFACRFGHDEIVKLLIECKDIDVNKHCKLHGSPLYVACKHGYPKVVALLLTSKTIDVNT
jgi:ankyrin repeat protein